MTEAALFFFPVLRAGGRWVLYKMALPSPKTLSGSPVARSSNALGTGVDRSAGEGFGQQICPCRSLRYREEIGDPSGAAEGQGDTRPYRPVVVDDGDQ